MPVLKALNNCYKEKKDLKNLVVYVVDKKGAVSLRGAQAVLLGDGQAMLQEMIETKKYFHKEKNRQALHYILSFSEEEEKYIKPKDALRIGYAIAECFPMCQVVFGVHEDTDNLHIHFVVNGTSFVDGKAFDMSYGQLRETQDYANVLAAQYYAMSLPEEERRQRLFRRIEGLGK